MTGTANYRVRKARPDEQPTLPWLVERYGTASGWYRFCSHRKHATAIRCAQIQARLEAEAVAS